jgi:hypothetical protein
VFLLEALDGVLVDSPGRLALRTTARRQGTVDPFP